MCCFYRQAADAVDAVGAHELGDLLARAGRFDEAEPFYRQAVEAGDAYAGHNLGYLLTISGRPDEAEPFYRLAADAGDLSAVANLARLMVQLGRDEEAECLYRQAFDGGDLGVAVDLALLLESFGREAEAEPVYRQALDAGVTEAALGLADLLTESGREEEAEALYRQALEAGHRDAAFALAYLLENLERLEEAEGFYRQAAEAGDARALVNLAGLVETERTDEAERLYRRALDEGITRAALGLTLLLCESGRFDEAEAAARQAVAGGEPHATHLLGVVLHEAGRLDEAEPLYRQAIADDPTEGPDPQHVPGADLRPVLGATDTSSLIAAVTRVYAQVEATNFPERAEAMADEIADSDPHLVGLQEVKLWRSQTPADFSPTPNATVVEYDFLQTLLDELAARGKHYAAVATITNSDREIPRSTPNGLQDIRLTGRDVILARTDLPAKRFSVANPQQGRFAARLVIPHPVLGSIAFPQGWVAVDATVGGRPMRVVSTHLEALSPAVQVRQGAELLDGPLDTDLPTVLLGDLNSAAGGVGAVPGMSAHLPTPTS